MSLFRSRTKVFGVLSCIYVCPDSKFRLRAETRGVLVSLRVYRGFREVTLLHPTARARITAGAIGMRGRVVVLRVERLCAKISNTYLQLCLRHAN